MPNRLIKEKSPYLLQHAENPVDWYAWGPEAFEKARRENKPIFLSIGYSTCHWCHVMEEESFVNPSIAKLLNEHFVSIKVDREERPDVDQIYMQAVMAIAGQGGWPMSLFLTPELKPFYGGTYFPPEDRWGRPGFAPILRAIVMKWSQNHDDLIKAGDEITQALKEHSGQKTKVQPLDESVLAKGYQQFSSQYDSHFGGFGGAPKFPRSHALSFLLRYWKRWNNPAALEIVEHTLKAMAAGGMYDQLGGGFHRYSVDGEWRVPHFEKMLYDQALLARTYLEAYQATRNEFYARIAREIFDYVLRDMTSPEGAFYSAEDADSLVDAAHPEKKAEGAFYVWSEDEIIRLCGKDVAAEFNACYGVKPEGNALSDPQGEFTGKNILYVQKTPGENIRKLKKILFDVRSKRPRPHLDDKILTDWNGLMISSLAFGARVLNEPRYAQAARKAADFILSKLKRGDSRLLHRFRDGEAAVTGFLEDYAFFTLGLADLYEATFVRLYLEEARFFAHEMIRLFWDNENGGFFLSGSDAEELIAPSKELYDGAIPSGNSMAACALLKTGRLTHDLELEKKARESLDAFSAHLHQFPSGFPQMLMALDFAIGPSREIMIEGDETSAEMQEILRVIYSKFLPNTVLEFKPVCAKTKVSICRNYVCERPVTDVNQLRDALA